jgi:uridine kinase
MIPPRLPGIYACKHRAIQAPHSPGKRMKGDAIVVEQHHVRAARGVVELLRSLLDGGARFTLSIAGESGSGKSETAQAVADELQSAGVAAVIFQQDDYFVYPPKSNDRERRKDIAWVGPQEVHLDLLDSHLGLFLNGADGVTKPLVNYADDSIGEEYLTLADVRVAIAEGTYTTLLENTSARAFIDRTYLQTRAHREKRQRDASELDAFIDRVLAIEHQEIASHKARASIIIDEHYNASAAPS